MTHSRPVNVRLFKSSDLEQLLELNNAAVPAVNELTAEELKALVEISLGCFVAELEGKVAGFLLGLSEGQNYDSQNYTWLSEHRPRFAYTDRICVDEQARGNRIGEKLYEALFDAQRGSGRSFVCEVNERPPNPGSVKFHSRLGFSEIGRKDHGEKAVVYMERPND